MLYNPEWEVQTKPDVFSLESLIAWLEKQPAAVTYKYSCNGSCLLAQYFTAMGFKNVEVSPYRFTHGASKTDVRFSDAFEEVAVDWDASKKDFTFGGALARARKALGK